MIARAARLLALAAALCIQRLRPASSQDAVGEGWLVVAVDALRADHVHHLGYDRETTPTIDRLAREGATFEQHFASAPWILPAHAALLSGCDPTLARRMLPSELGLEAERTWWLPERLPRLATWLLADGWRTLALADHPWLAPVYGFDAGFQRFVEIPGELGRGAARLDEQSQALLGWLSSVERTERWFAYLHVHDLERAFEREDPQRDTYFPPRAGLEAVPPHGNVEPIFFAVPPRHSRGVLRSMGEYEARYDGALRLLDLDLAELLDGLARLGRLERTGVMVIGTYGFEFGEGGLVLDHGMLAQSDLSVPWILRPPADPAAAATIAPGTRVAALSSAIDLAPTLLALAGIERPPGMHGVSQLATLCGGAAPRVLAMASCGFQKGWAVMGPTWTLEFTHPSEAASEALVSSWYGGPAPPEAGWVERAFERRRAPGGGLAPAPREIGPLAGPAEAAAALREQGIRWFVSVELARQVMHPLPWLRAPVPQNTIADLIAAGLLPPAP